jgi:hypothetical protein
MDSFLKAGLCFLAFVVLLSSPVHGQEVPDTLGGLVFDEATGSPLGNAVVSLTDIESGSGGVTVTTDKSGRFAIPVAPGHYWLTATHPGYASSPPREVLWDHESESVDGILLHLRPLDAPAVSVEAEGAASSEDARVFGRVFDEGSGDPVYDAEVLLSRAGLRAATNHHGMFVFPEVPPGDDTLKIRHLGYAEQTILVHLDPASAYRVEGRVSPDPIEVEGIEVHGTSQDWFRRMDGLKWRMDRGSESDYILAEQLEVRNYPPVAEALRSVPGVTVRRYGFDWKVIVSRCRRGDFLRSPSPVIYLDGIKVYKPDRDGDLQSILSQITTMDIEAIEVYKGGASVPAAYAGSDAQCGVILIWSKRGR